MRLSHPCICVIKLIVSRNHKSCQHSWSQSLLFRVAKRVSLYQNSWSLPNLRTWFESLANEERFLWWVTTQKVTQHISGILQKSWVLFHFDVSDLFSQDFKIYINSYTRVRFLHQVWNGGYLRWNRLAVVYTFYSPRPLWDSWCPLSWSARRTCPYRTLRSTTKPQGIKLP